VWYKELFALVFVLRFVAILTIAIYKVMLAEGLKRVVFVE
jgi:hypothetical protein